MYCLQMTPDLAITDHNPSSPAALVTRIQAGDPRAEEELVARYYRAVRLVLQRLMRRRSDAEDLLQETFRMALVKLRKGELKQPSRLSSFLVSLARNLAINQFRIETRRRTDSDSEAVEGHTFTTPDPLGRMIASEKANLVRRVLAELANPRDREILYRFYLAEDDKAAICDDLNLSSLHFNRVLYRARRRYRRLLDSHT